MGAASAPLPVFGHVVHREQVRTAHEALVYLTDCTLATVAQMALRTSRPEAEYRRQQALAQLGVNWCRTLPWVGAFRVPDVLRDKLTVAQWAQKYEVAPAKQPEVALPQVAAVESHEQALLVLTNGVLVTVRHLARMRSRSPVEYQRQKCRAEFGVQWCRAVWLARGLILPLGVSVADWAESMEVPVAGKPTARQPSLAGRPPGSASVATL